MPTGARIIITGATKGIGKSLALYLASQGARVVICSRNKNDVESLCKENPLVLGLPADVSVEEDCKRLMEFSHTSLGGIDALINNAGILGEVGSFLTSESKTWGDALRINVIGTANATRAVLPYMIKAGKGKIINFAGGGVGGKKPLINRSSYFTSKIAIVGFTEALAAELSGENIQINAVAPGAINTDLTEYLLSQGKERMGEDLYQETLKQKETGGDDVQNVCELITYLISEESDHLSGRLLSAKWDKKSILNSVTKEDTDLLKLRRIDEVMFRKK